MIRLIIYTLRLSYELYALNQQIILFIAFQRSERGLSNKVELADVLVFWPSGHQQAAPRRGVRVATAAAFSRPRVLPP